ncbi:AAA family ATPase [Collimonas pratensis]|uniref:AAA family ATPase n=1 Tax=Collimonas pratensis TaxID=279113 RepID=UPI0007811355|nr:AAA family ATPase [Collimonas pratensis]
MTISTSASNALWDSFLRRWPLEKLPQMTLQEYTKAGDADCFTYGWLEQRTEQQLGSIWGGSAFKFGVYSRKDQSDKLGGAGRAYSTDYGWYAKYGPSAEAAFSQVRNIICKVAGAARTGDLEAVQQADLGAAIKWKIAFLYQDRAAPSVLPIYSADHLAAFLEQKSKRNIPALHAAAMAQRGDIDVCTFGAQIWKQAEARLAAMTLRPKDALAFLQDSPDRFQPIKGPNQYIAGFTTGEGRSLALALDTKKAKLWLEPGAWLDAVKGQLKDIDVHPAERQRNSNLAATAPDLAEGNVALYLTVPTYAALLALFDAYDNTDLNESKIMATESTHSPHAIVPLNQILYGPPGTGKTHATIKETLRILDPAHLQTYEDSPKKLKERFDALITSEQARFVTFHQSYSYEDFVEGLRATTNDDKQPEYVIEPGVFKRLCDDARTQGVQPNAGIRSNPRIWKISINGSGASPTKNYCINHGEARIGWGDTGDLRAEERNDYYKKLGIGDQGTLTYFAQDIVPGDILLMLHSAEMIGAVGVVTGDYRYDEMTPDGIRDDYQHVRLVTWLYHDLKLSILPLNDNKQLTLKTVYPIDRFTWGDLLSYLEQSGVVPVKGNDATGERKPHVLIIDEINRGNISRIFGELITLIEPSKRVGKEDALIAVLPYSKKPFSVPDNVYLIGTMNTADRSLAGLDIALRRRFTFKEMPPRPDLLDGTVVKGANMEGVNIGLMLRKMNERIEVLLDRDHCLGHAYFMPLHDTPTLAGLGFIFRQQILPLLQEYFFEDWERIAWVLNDQNKSPVQAFVQKASTNLASLFGPGVAENLQNMDRRWRINADAFGNIESYRGIIEVAA